MGAVRPGGDAPNEEEEPVQARLLAPLLLGLAGDFDSPAVRATSALMFSVRSLISFYTRPHVLGTQPNFILYPRSRGLVTQPIDALPARSQLGGTLAPPRRAWHGNGMVSMSGC